MFLTVHAAAAAYVVQQTQNPLLVFLLSLLSHLVLDFIPHGDEFLYDKHKPWKEQSRRLYFFVLTDVIVATATILWLIQYRGYFTWLYILALVGAWLPDALTAWQVICRIYGKPECIFLQRIQSVHIAFHHYFRYTYHFTLCPAFGMVVQFIVWLGFIFLLF